MAAGIKGQFGVGAEVTPGTEVAVNRFYEVDAAPVSLDKTILQGGGIRAGGRVARASRRKVSRYSVAGSPKMDHSTRQMGLLWKHALGSPVTAPVLIAGSAYRQVHTLGSQDGMGLTVQVGKPEAAGSTVQPHTYRGCKITQWELSVSDGELVKFNLDIDGWDESTVTPLAAASYPVAEVFSFADVGAGGFTLGGTVTTTGGVASVAGATNVATLVKNFTLTGKSGMATDRYGLGNAGIKSEQGENDIMGITAKLGAEFTSRAEFYDHFRSDDTLTLHLVFTGSVISGTDRNTLDVLLPACRLNTATANLDGPDILSQDLELEILDDGVNTPIQVTITSADAAL